MMTKGISLSLAGGGARGFVHVGVLSVLLTEGLPVVEVAGSSMGAVVAAFYAAHGTVVPLAEFAATLDRTSMLFFFDPCIPRHSFMKGNKLRKLLEEWFGDRRIEKTEMPLSIVVTELRTGKDVVLRKGRIVDALMASCAIPGLLPAVRLGGDYYVDGGVSQPLPLSALRRQNTVHIGVALPALKDFPPRMTMQPTLTEVLTLVYATARQPLFAPKDGSILLFPEAGTMGDILSFHRSDEFVRNGEKAARDAVPRIIRLLQE